MKTDLKYLGLNIAFLLLLFIPSEVLATSVGSITQLNNKGTFSVRCTDASIGVVELDGNTTCATPRSGRNPKCSTHWGVESAAAYICSGTSIASKDSLAPLAQRLMAELRSGTSVMGTGRAESQVSVSISRDCVWETRTFNPSDGFTITETIDFKKVESIEPTEFWNVAKCQAGSDCGTFSNNRGVSRPISDLAIFKLKSANQNAKVLSLLRQIAERCH